MELSYAPPMGRIHSLLLCTSNNALLATTAASKPSWRPLKSLGFRPQGLASGLSFSTGIRFSELHQYGISPLHGFRLPINGRRLKFIGRASPSFREPSEEQNSFLCSGSFFRNASSSRIFTGNSGAFAGGGVSANFDRECEIHDIKNQLEDAKGKHRVSRQTGESTDIASSESPRRTSERKTSTSSKGLGLSGDLPTDRKVEGKVRKTVHKFHSSSQTFSTRSYSKQTERRTYSATKTSSTTVTLQDTAVKSKQSAVEGPKMDNHRGQKRPAPVGKDGNNVMQMKKKKYTADQELRRDLDMCSKYADAIKAIALYDKIVAEKKMKLNQYNFNVLLYLCASGASDALKPSLSTNRERKEGNVEEHQKAEAENIKIDSSTTESGEEVTEAAAITLTEEEKKMCLERGFKIYAAMKEEGVAPNEATFTAVARLAVAQGDGDLAFDMVKQMAAANLAPKLRSYGPALFTYCKSNMVDKAFEVDDHMREAGVEPEESELEALLQVSVQANLGDKVYSLLHRLRKSVRELKPNTSEVIERWFCSSAATAANISSREEDVPRPEDVQIAIEKGGGGWHGLGWLGKGKWDIAVSHLDKSGVCNLCREKLVTIDIDPKDTDMFAESLSKLACQREAKNNEFKRFQAWLDQHGPFDTVVDGANVGLYGQNWDQSVNFHQLNAVVNLVQQRSPSKRAPLIILHHRRTKGGSAASTYASNLLKKWTQNNTIYTTPTGSNDDWYWLYAAVKNKCLLVTDDEMRDHLFQLLGNDFFPKWKERHQVRFTITKEEGLALHMPPPYSIVIQESANGSWHIPKAGGDDISSPRDWLCITRPGDRDLNGESCSIDSSITETLSAAGDDLLGEITPKWTSSQRLKVVKASAQEDSHQSSPDMSSSRPKIDRSKESPQRTQFKGEKRSKASSNASSPTRSPNK